VFQVADLHNHRSCNKLFDTTRGNQLYEPGRITRLSGLLTNSRASDELIWSIGSKIVETKHPNVAW
jgi:hypothetical protein